ncbi:hypothetical protein EMIT0373P_10465 [Pseudomonas chlororaphis]
MTLYSIFLATHDTVQKTAARAISLLQVGVMQRNSRYRSAPLVQIVDQVSPLPHALLQSPQQLISNDS